MTEPSGRDEALAGGPRDEPTAPARRRGPLIAATTWLRGYGAANARADVIAGLTLAAYMLPAGIGDASLAGLPPEAGLYACIFSGLVFWLLCSSRRTSVTVTSAISILIGTSLAPLAAGDPARHAALAACTALLVGAIALVAWAIRAGSIVNFVSESVLVGFKVGVALTLASTQLPKLFGLSSAHGDFWENSHHFLSHLGETNRVSLTVGLAALALLVLGKLFLPNRPVALFAVIGGVIAAGWLGLGDRGVKMLGELPAGLPALALPGVLRADPAILNELLPLALACFLLAAVETTAIGRMFAARHGGRIDANQEFLAIAGANLATGLGQGFPVSGGMSQSLVNESAGARTPLSGLVSAALILVIAVFFSGSLRNLPQPVLAAIVLMAVVGLVKIPVIRHLWRNDRTEFVIAMAALAGVLTAGLLKGVLIGAVISLLLLIRRAASPHVAFLGRIPGTRRFSDRERNPDNEPVEGIVIFRSEGSILYFNAEHVHDSVMERVRSVSPLPHGVVCDLSASPHVDLAGAEMLKGLEAELRGLGIRLRIVEARSRVRDRLRREGLAEVTERIDRRATVADAVEELQASRGEAQPPKETASPA